jgi:glutamate mutase epsilon subunit
MNIIIYGENNEVFESNCFSVPETIVELYEHCGGRISRELFDAVINGMVHTATIADMVIIFEQLVAGGATIKKIYASANKYYTEV